MIDIFFSSFIFLLLLVLITILCTYRIISKKLHKTKSVDKNIRILRGVTGIIVVFVGIIAFRIGIWLYENPRVTDPNYNRSIYSVVVYNTTDIPIDRMEVVVGENRLFFKSIDDIKPQEYRKVNILTEESNFIDTIEPPYNVYVREPNNINTEICIGYFGIRTGGVEVVNIVHNDEKNIILEKENHSSRKYIRILRLHRKNQNLLNWYD